MNNKAFSTKELLMVLVVIGILCYAAVPQFFALQRSKRQTDMEKTIVQVNIALKEKGEEMPTFLDSEPTRKSCQNCFNAILEKGIKNDFWYKYSENEYYFSKTGKTGTLQAFQDEGNFKVIYNREQGLFIPQNL